MHLELEGRFDRAHLLQGEHGEGDVKLLVSITPGEALQHIETGVGRGTNVCLLFDVSQSMEEEEKLDGAIDAGRELVSLINENTLVSVVAFDEEAYVLGSCLPTNNRQAIYTCLERLRTVGGGMTNISVGMTQAVAEILRAEDKDRARIIILLSDGEDNVNKPDAITSAGRAAEENIQLFGVGIGADYEANFLKAMVTPSNGSLFGYREVEKVKEAFIDLAVKLSSVVATHATLELTFARDVLVGKGYKASPDQLFLGHTQVPESRVLQRRVGNIEKHKVYSFLYDLHVPTDKLGSLKALGVRLRYDVPALGLHGVVQDLDFGVTIGRDVALAGKQDGAVLECYRRVQISELVDRFVEAHRQGRAEQTAQYLELLIEQHDDVNDQKMVNHYRDIQRELLVGGKITRAMINASVVASTVVKGGGEVPRLIDDDF